jgi:hypothetical protein
MLDIQAEFGVCRRVAAQPVRYDPAWATVALEQFAHEPFGSRLVAAALHQYVKPRAVLIDRAP